MKALVEATPISGPACVGSTASAIRAISLPGTLTIAATGEPERRASRSAARVSAVSPDCEMPTVRVRPSTTGRR